MARIIQQGSINTTGVSFENEPIIKSDGAGEIMQWQPSDGGADGVFIIQDASTGSAELGIGVTPTAPLSVYSTTPSKISLQNNSSGTGAGNGIEFYMSGLNAGIHNYEAGALNFATSNTNRLTISSAGAITMNAFTFPTGAGSAGQVLKYPSSGSTLEWGTTGFGSLDIGHGLIGETASTAIGTDALDATQSGAVRNTAVGQDALGAVTTGDYNVAVGAYAGDIIQANSENTAVGDSALGTNAGSRNTAIGRAAMGIVPGGATTTSSEDNVAVGHDALYTYYGSGAVAVGSGAADAATTQTAIVAIGKDALGALSHADGDENTAVGSSALAALTAGSGVGYSNTAVGAGSLGATVDGYKNTAVGEDALGDGDCGLCNTAVGRDALKLCASDYNVAVGSNSGDAITTGVRNTAVGHNSLGGTDTGHDNVAIGNSALAADCVDDNVAVGKNALTVFTGSDATVVGSNAADALTDGARVTAIGYAAMGLAC